MPRMQGPVVENVLLGGSASASTSARSALSCRDLGARSPSAGGAGSALMAPVAMLVGAFGLLILWTAAPPRTVRPQPAMVAASSKPSARQYGAVEQAALHQSAKLSGLLAGLGAPVPLTIAKPVQLTLTAAATVASLRVAEADMVSAVDLDAHARLKTMQAVFRSTGLDARPYMAAVAPASGLSPLELRDPRVLAARLDLDTPLARVVQHTARDLMAADALSEATKSLPLATPVDNPVRSSPFGERIDPFTQQTAFHPGQDFAGRYGDAIRVTAPGVLSFAGQRTGYGNCVEVDHGHGFKTRYAHLSAFTLGVGHQVTTGDVVGRMGSTGRSTGVHLHYEVWASGRLMNPAPFLDTGMTLQKTRA